METLAHDDLREQATLNPPLPLDTDDTSRRPTIERDGAGVPAPEVEAHPLSAGESLATAWVDSLTEDVTLAPRGQDTPARLTASGEGLELVLGDRQAAEQCYRRALRVDPACQQAHESLRRLHRTSGNWRTVAQLYTQEIAVTEGERRGQLTLLLELLCRTRPESGTMGPLASQPLAADLPESYLRLEALLKASQAMAIANIDRALALRSEAAPFEVDVDIDVEGDDDEASKAAESVEERGRRAAFQEWTWSAANLRRFLLKDSASALQLLLTVFRTGRRDPELLDALSELLTEHANWDELRSVLECAVGEGSASAADYETLASLLDQRYRDLPAAVTVLERGVHAFPEDATLARRLAEALAALQDNDRLIDALGNVLEVTDSPSLKAQLYWQIGRLFEEATCMTSAAIEVFQQAVATDPHHGPALRALGRIYTRQNNWYGLADLFERELAAPGTLPDAWRRHFKLAEIYEERLHNNTAALRHYQATLEARPEFLPALEAIERLLSIEGDWDDLARVFHKVARKSKSRRRQIDLLERAARLSEERIDNDMLLSQILHSLLEADPESTVAFSGLERLFRRARRWEELLQLHLREATFTEPAEETATLFWKSGRIAEREIKDSRRAEELYRNALGATPDFLPALQDLGRILNEDHRWEALLDISNAELEVTRDEVVKARRLEATAELLEQRLGRRPAAVDTYERIVELGVEDTVALDRLIVLFSEQGRWEQVAELVERKAATVDKTSDAAELHHRLGELRERRLGQPQSALEAYAQALAAEPDHVHALRALLRLNDCVDKDRDALVTRVARDCHTDEIRRLALRHLARRAEVTSDNPAAGMEHRRTAVEANPNDREARDLLEAAFAHRRDVPGLVGLWCAAGRTIDEGLLGLLGVGAGIDSAALLDAFLARWGEQLEEQIEFDGRVGLLLAALGELSKGGLGHLAATSLSDSLQRDVPGAVQRRLALARLGQEGGAAKALALLDRTPIREPASLRLRAMLAGDDRKGRVEATRAEVDALLSPELRVCRLLELARLDSPRRHEYFLRAAGQEAFDSAVQEQLYELLEEHGEHALLAQVLEQHLCSDELSVRRRSHLAFWLGKSIERSGGEPFEALCAYRTSYQSGHDRHEALLDMARLTGELGDQWDAIRCLEAFLTLSSDVEQRLDAGLKLATLYLAEATPATSDPGYNPYAGAAQHDGGTFGRKAIDLLGRLRDESRDTTRERETIARLAHAHCEVGSPYRAIDHFQEILSGEPTEDQLDDYVALANLYLRSLHDRVNAEQILWLVWETFPGRKDVLDQLLAVCHDAGTTLDACARIEQNARMAAPENLTAADRRSLLELVSTVYADDLGRYRVAADLWRELADGAGTNKEERRLRVRQAESLCRVAGEEAACHALMLSLHSQDPFDLSPYQGLETLYYELQDHERLRTVQQIRYVLDPAVADSMPADQSRRKVHPSRTFDEPLLHAHLLPEGLGGGVLEVLRALTPLASKVWAELIPTVDALGGRKWRGDEFDQVREMAEIAAETFRMPRIKLHLGDSGPGNPQVFGVHPNVSVWFHRGMFDGAGAEVGRFMAGYAAGLAWSGVSPLTHIDGRELWHLLEAVLIKQSGVGLSEVTDPRSMELVDAVGGTFNRSVRKRILDVASPCLHALRNAHCEAWPTMIHVLAMRSGLVLSGQATGAVQAILRGRQWRGHMHEPDTQDHLRKLPEVADLFRFALSDDYLALRHGCGLSVRARTIS